MIKVLFNGKEFEVEDGTTLDVFLTKYINLEGKFAVEVNLEVVSKSSYSEVFLKNNMKIEAINFVGGG